MRSLMFSLRSTLSAALVLGICGSSLVFAGGPHSGHRKISSDAERQSSAATIPVIIQYTNDPQPSTLVNLRNHGAFVQKTLHSIRAVHARVPRRVLEDLANDPGVAYISLDRPVAALDTVDITALDYSNEPINAPAVWAQGFIGTNIGVAVIDSGVTPVPDLGSQLQIPGQPAALQFAAIPNQVAPGSTGRIVYSENFVSGESDALDHFGHGTHVAGLIAGNGSQSNGSQYFRTFAGSAPNANLINLRVLDENGAGTDSAVIAAIERAIA